MPFIIPANTLAASGFDVDNSCRFNIASSDSLSRTPSSGSNRKTFTISMWVKGTTTTTQTLMSAGETSGAYNFNVQWAASKLSIIGNADSSSIMDLKTTALYRDFSAWYHFVLAFDTTQSTAANRVKVYVNGVQETSFSTETYPARNTNIQINNNTPHSFGMSASNNQFWGGYMAELILIDGSALAPTSFGEFDEDSGIWKPIKISGLTFGTNGFYLEIKQSGTSANSSGLGADTSGNTHHFTVNNLTAINSTTDTCTNNFCTWNSLDTFYNTMTFQEGNTQGTKPNSTVESYGTSTFGITSGKWYAEFKVISFSGSNSTIGFGIIDRVAVQNDKEIGKHTYGISYKSNGDVFSADGNLLTNQGTLAANDIIGLYIDIDNLKFYFAKNGTIANSGTGLAIPALTSTLNGVYFFGFDNFQAGGSVHQANWGNPAYTGTDKADANGFGSFEYDPSSGTFDSASKDFLALCTKNLAEYGG